MKKRAFTLVELLVVISIIAILMGILMPVLSKVKNQGRFIVCRANLREYGKAGRMYVIDNDDRFPNPQTWLFRSSGNTLLDPCAWHDPKKRGDGAIWEIMKDMDVHMCPTFYTLARSVGADHPQHDPSIPIEPRYSYSMNVYLGYPSSESGVVRKASDVKRPSEVIFFTEENLWTIEGLSLYALNNNIFWTTDNVSYDCLATYHQTRGSDMNSGVANIVFVDGSVDTGRAEDSYKLAYPKRR